MPNTREKLIELLGNLQDHGIKRTPGLALPSLPCNEIIAAHLIANGVTVQEWISVKDGLPKLIPCDAGTAYSEAVNVLTSGRKVLTAIWDGFDWICDAEFWDAEDEEITHWIPVLLPLPEPPKGE